MVEFLEKSYFHEYEKISYYSNISDLYAHIVYTNVMLYFLLRRKTRHFTLLAQVVPHFHSEAKPAS